ncbi:MAG: sigma-54 dependent transcriptional regulator [Elusimicrobiota bacterium]
MKTCKATLLLIDDEPDLCGILSAFLQARGYRVLVSYEAASALKSVAAEPIDLVLLDLHLQGVGGMELLARFKEMDPNLPVMILTGKADVATAVAAMRAGAQDFLAKPFANEELGFAVERALKQTELMREVASLRVQVRAAARPEAFVGESPAVKKLLEQIKAVAATDLTVILHGESGSGKELAARMVHGVSPRSGGPFVALDCGALPETLIESELFGYERGAFTGADALKAGLFEVAFKGTLFLDEVCNLPLGAQATLLRTLETKCVRHLGGKRDITIDTRIIVATNKDLAVAVREGMFRDDLYFRLNQFAIHLPSLKERKQDIPMLAGHFLKHACKELGRTGLTLDEDALKRMTRYAWPGNVRELKNVITRACLMAQDVIRVEHLELGPARKTGGASDTPARSVKFRTRAVASRRGAEKKMILGALRKTGNNRRQAAKLLGIHRSVFYAKLKECGII